MEHAVNVAVRSYEVGGVMTAMLVRLWMQDIVTLRLLQRILSEQANTFS